MNTLPPLVWIDLEMTGLDTHIDTILEASLIITDAELQPLMKPVTVTIHHPDSVLENMNEWSIKHHGESGLTQRVRESTTTMKEAEQILLQHIKALCPEKKSYLCGNSIFNDRNFLAKDMPELLGYLHYRLLDVTTLKILKQYWFPNVNEFEKSDSHMAETDIQESIEELAYYRNEMMKKLS